MTVSLSGSDADRAAILRVVESWGVLRDAGRLDLLQNTFAPGAIMHTSASSGPADVFIANARNAPSTPGKAQHIYGGAHVEVSGDKGLSESRMQIVSRRPVDGVEVDLTAFMRMLDRFVRTPEGWRILERFPYYERARVDAVEPNVTIKLDLAPFADYPPELKVVAAVQRAGGREVPPRTLELTRDYAQVYEQWRAWLVS